MKRTCIILSLICMCIASNAQGINFPLNQKVENTARLQAGFLVMELDTTYVINDTMTVVVHNAYSYGADRTKNIIEIYYVDVYPALPSGLSIKKDSGNKFLLTGTPLAAAPNKDYVLTYNGELTNKVTKDTLRNGNRIIYSKANIYPNMDHCKAINIAAGYKPTTTMTFSTGDVAIYNSTKDVKDVNMKVYPNPVMNLLNITAVENITKLTLLNLSGSEVLQTNPNTLTANVNVSNISAGTYIVKICTASGTAIKKVVKQ